MTHKGKTIIITGGSRGIGHAIALRFAAACANVVVLSKDSPQNIDSTNQEIIAAGGNALVLNIDISDINAISRAISQTVGQFGNIDILVNNTSATCFTNTFGTSPEQFDLIISTSVRAAFFMSQACLPHLKKSINPHIINISPPINIDANCFKDHLAFSISKYAMSLCTLGMAAEFQSAGIAVNSLWPETTIATSTITDHFSPQVYASSRWPSIMADAAYALVLQKSKECSGLFFTDEELLEKTGVTDFSHYAVDPTVSLMHSLFVPQDSSRTSVSQSMYLQNKTKRN